MNKLFFSLLLLFAMQGYSQDFYRIAKTVTELDYHLTDGRYRMGNTGEAFMPALKNNWYNRRLVSVYGEEVKRDSTIAPTVIVGQIKSIEVFYLKSNKKVEDDFYGRAEIQKWVFVDSKEAATALGSINWTRNDMAERLYKGPWVVWQKEDALYFILCASTYMADKELPKIEKWLREKASTE